MQISSRCLELKLTLDLGDDVVNVSVVQSLSTISDAILSVGGLGMAITIADV